MLYVDANYGVSLVFPLRDQEATAHLAPGAAVMTPRMEVTPPTGWEEVLLIATPRAGLRLDLRILEQPSLDRLRVRGGSASEQDLAPTAGPLGALVRRVSLSEGTRSQPVAEFRDYLVRMLTWRTETKTTGGDGTSVPR